MTNEVADNYVYWQENGQGWFAEYARRKMFIPYFHIQEIFLTEYVARSAPAKVLEYGCGVGRHLRNLSRLGGVHVFGYDQSPTMIAEMHHWATPEWISENVRLGPPVGSLPFANGEFDIVFTSEVLIHTRPEHIEGILAEFLRVCRGKILHIEPEPDVALLKDSHDGCWGHDLIGAYKSLGVRAERLPKLFNSQTMVEVLVDQRSDGGVPLFHEVTCDLFRKMEADLEPLINRALGEGLLDSHPETDCAITLEEIINPVDGSLCPTDGANRARLVSSLEKLSRHICELQNELEAQTKLENEVLNLREAQKAHANINVQFMRENSELRKRLTSLERHVEQSREITSKVTFIENWKPYKYASRLRGRYYALRSLIRNHSQRMQISSHSGAVLHIRKLLLGERVLPWALIDFSNGSKYSIDPNSGSLILYKGAMRVYGQGDWRMYFEHVPFEGSFTLDRGGELSAISYSELEALGFVVSYFKN